MLFVTAIGAQEGPLPAAGSVRACVFVSYDVSEGQDTEKYQKIITDVLGVELVNLGLSIVAREEWRDAQKEMGLSDKLRRHVRHLSQGERQRAAVCRALLLEPPLLLCDEPTGNLDQNSADTVGSLLLEVHKREETILVVVTHHPGLAARFPVQLELDEGKLRPRH